METTTNITTALRTQSASPQRVRVTGNGLPIFFRGKRRDRVNA